MSTLYILFLSLKMGVTKNHGEDPHGADFYKKKQNCTGTKGNLQKKEKEGGLGRRRS
jgi:hypothetical protein